jgi:outer membrane protein assembly factor BamB
MMKVIFWLLILTTVALGAPELTVYPDTVKFGMISIGGNHSRTFAAYNTGDSELIINSIDMPDPVLTLSNPSLPITLNAGDSINISIQFNPVDITQYDGDIQFFSNDPNSPLSIPAVASGIDLFLPGEIIWSYQGIENVVSCAAIEDIDGDEIMDVIAESYDAGANGDPLTAVSGSGFNTGQLIWSAHPQGGPSNSGGYGDECLDVISDLNGNGTPDIIRGAAWGCRSVFAIEGSTGETIWSYDTYQNPPSGWVYGVATAGDVNGDNVPDVLAGAGSDANRAWCFDGATGDPIWTLIAGDAVFDVVSIGDVNDDQIPDAVIASGDFGDDKVYCISGASNGVASQIWTYSTGGADVHVVDKIGDLNNDGYNDVIAGTWYNGDRVIALSGHSSGTADTIWTSAIGNHVMKVVSCPDLNSDGYEDVLVASWSNIAIALSGFDGTFLWSYHIGNDVWSIYWSYDVTNDGIADVAAGSFTGSVYLIDGSSGSLVWETPSESKIFTIRPIKDVNGDGYNDIIAGQQYLQNQGGRFYVISGGTLDPQSVDDDDVLPTDMIITSNYPNPFNSSTTISYTIPESSHAKLEIYNLKGQLIATLLNRFQTAGYHQLEWNGRDNSGKSVATGIYFYSIKTENFNQTSKMALLK